MSCNVPNNLFIPCFVIAITTDLNFDAYMETKLNTEGQKLKIIIIKKFLSENIIGEHTWIFSSLSCDVIHIFDCSRCRYMFMFL